MTDRPRVILDALLVRPEPTGVGRAILELIRAMSARDRGLSLTVLVTHPEMFAFLDGVPHWQLQPCCAASGGTLRKALYTQVELPRLVRRLGGSLLHSLQFVAPLRLSCASVVTVHDLTYRRYPHAVEQPRRAYYGLTVPRTLQQAARILTNSAATAKEVKAFFPDLAARVRETPFGTPSWVWQQSAPPLERSVGAPFLFVGTLEPRKNLERLLQAYEIFLNRQCAQHRRTQAQAPDLVLVGARGWGDARLWRQIQRLTRTKLRHEGYCGPDRLWQIYGSARALLFPSLHEGFGFPILEAMAANLPVMTANRGAMAEVAGKDALLVDPENVQEMALAMARIHEDEALRCELIARGRARALDWSWERTADRTVAVYDELLGVSGHQEWKK